MNLSPYFHDQLDGYQAEIDDLTSDSEGKDVLQRRLKDKRSEFAAIVGMLDTDPLLLAPAFHGAFSFPEDRAEAVEDLLTRAPGDFRPWAEIAGQIRVASWAEPMVALALEQAEGDDFLSLVLGLEYALTRHKSGGRDHADDGDRSDDARDGIEEDDGSEADAQGEDFLEQQGFDRRIPK
jgi:hypothetical protein